MEENANVATYCDGLIITAVVDNTRSMLGQMVMLLTIKVGGEGMPVVMLSSLDLGGI